MPEVTIVDAGGKEVLKESRFHVHVHFFFFRGRTWDGRERTRTDGTDVDRGRRDLVDGRDGCGQAPL